MQAHGKIVRLALGCQAQEVGFVIRHEPGRGRANGWGHTDAGRIADRAVFEPDGEPVASRTGSADHDSIAGFELSGFFAGGHEEAARDRDHRERSEGDERDDGGSVVAVLDPENGTIDDDGLAQIRVVRRGRESHQFGIFQISAVPVDAAHGGGATPSGPLGRAGKRDGGRTSEHGQSDLFFISVMIQIRGEHGPDAADGLVPPRRGGLEFEFRDEEREAVPADFEWLARHEWLVSRQASRYFHRTPGCRDDLLQECRIALLRARKMYDGNRKVPSAAYASRVLSRAAQKFVITETRCGFGGQILLRTSDAPRVTSSSDGGDSTPPIESVADDYRPPLHRTEYQWAKIFHCLSETQQEVVRLRVFKRLSNREVGELLGFRESREFPLAAGPPAPPREPARRRTPVMRMTVTLFRALAGLAASGAALGDHLFEAREFCAFGGGCEAVPASDYARALAVPLSAIRLGGSAMMLGLSLFPGPRGGRVLAVLGIADPDGRIRDIADRLRSDLSLRLVWVASALCPAIDGKS